MVQALPFPEMFNSSKMKEQKQLSNSAPFPAVLEPASLEFAGKENLINGLERLHLERLLSESGAVLLRGFNLEGPSDFNQVMESIGGEEFPYSVGGEATRHRVEGRVFTANDGIPLNKPIGFHNEVAYLPNSPARIVFFCEAPAAAGAGGSTLIAHGRTVYEKMVESGHQKFLDELYLKGVRYMKLLAEDGHGSWKSMFQTADKAEAERRAETAGASLEWLPDGRARFFSKPCPGVKINKVSGEKVWFNSIAGIQVYKANSPPGSFDAVFGDGTSFPEEALEACLRVLDEEKVAFAWKKGDLLVLDNMNVLHARQPSSSPRTILVSLSK